ncbi:MAG: cell division protein SepF [Actinobacteria bacterium]|nr:cell division protein SepF [Actinomycetota bacterium]
MSLNDYWQKTLEYFGMAGDGYDDYDEYDDHDGHHDRETNARVRDDDGRGSRRSSSSRAADFDAIYSDPGVPSPSRNLRPAGGSGGGRSSSRGVEVSLIIPRSFNDAQDIADKFKRSIPVILNLQTTDRDLSKRLIDFGSGLTYALDGGMSRIADRVFLLTPRNVEVSAEERARLLEKGFFNQY